MKVWKSIHTLTDEVFQAGVPIVFWMCGGVAIGWRIGE